MTHRLLTVQQVAEFAGVHPKTVRSAIRAGRLKAARFSERGQFRIREVDYEAWVESMLHRPVTVDPEPVMIMIPRRTRSRPTTVGRLSA